MHQEEEQQSLMNRQSRRQEQQEQEPLQQSPQQVISNIHNTRIRREMEYLKDYHYSHTVHVNGVNEIAIYDLWAHQAQNEEIMSKSLKIYLPDNYPFREPKFQLQGGQTMLISEIMDQWSPKYKLMEMINLLKMRIEQREKLDAGLSHNWLYLSFKSYSSWWLVFLIALFIRALVGLGSYSGKGDWPNLGDFQAHRNWMSITVNTPITEWYVETMSDPWWRIDYPPVAAYLSFIFGQFYRHIEPKAMNLQFGYESSPLTAFMRFTVLLIDVILLLPGIYLLCSHFSPSKYRNTALHISLLLLICLKPDQILIDHGHFQYNSLMLGLILLAFSCLVSNRKYLCCFLFTLAINCKLMSVYYSLAFFAALIGLAGRNKSLKKHKADFIFQLLKFGGIVIVTTLILWLPWLNSFQNLKNTLSAIFPVHRGLYQLKVPNFWCISDILIKWQSWLSKPFLTLLCMLACITFSIPSMVALMIRSSSKKVLAIAFSTIAMTFFMFSYHVHEKSILLPLAIMPFCSQYIGGKIVIDVMIGGCLGMYHLLVEDGQALAYFVMLIVYLLLAHFYYQAEERFIIVYQPHTLEDPSNPQPFIDKVSPITMKLHSTIYNNFFRIMLYSAFLGLHLGKAMITPPQSLPYLWNLLFAFYSFCLNCYFLAICNSILLEEIYYVARISKRE